MKKKKAPSPKPRSRKTAPRARTKTTSRSEGQKPSQAGSFWDDDRAFRILFRNSYDIYTFVNARGKILYRSPSAHRMIHRPDHQVLKSDLSQWIWPEDREGVRETFARILQSPGKTIPFQARIQDKNGEPQWVQGFATNYLENPAIGAILVNYHDDTERKQHELELRENERRYRELFENAALAIFQSTFNGKVIRVNPEFARMFGYESPDDVLSSVKNVGAHLYVDPARREEIIRLRREDPSRSRFENLYRRRDGSAFWGLLNVRTVTDAEGKGLYDEGCIEDINERKRAEEALRESAEEANAMMASAPYGITFVDTGGKITFANPAAERILGLTGDEIVHRTYDDPKWSITALDGEPFPPDQLPFNRVMADKRAVYDVEHAIELEDGRRVLLSINGAPLFRSDGTVSGMVSTIRDITERKRAEQALRESEERYRNLFSNSLEGIGLSVGNRIIDANKALLEIFGYEDLEEFRSIPLLDHVAPEFKEEIQRRLRALKEGKQTEERFAYRIVRKNGEKRDLEISTNHIRIGDVVYTQSTFRDITERMRAEEMLREKEERFHATFENANVGVCIVGLDGSLLQVNRQMSEIFGYGREELEQMNVNTIAHPDDKDLSPSFIEQALAGEVRQGNFDKRYIHKDGHIVWGQVSSSLVRDPKGQPLYFISHVQDVTERKRAEEELRTLAFRHEALLAAIPEIVMEVDARKVYTWTNPAGIEFFGEDVLGKEAAFYFEGEQETYGIIQPVFKGTQDTVYVESWQRRKDGQKRLLAWWCRALKNAAGEVTGALSSARDITDRRLAEKQIQILSRFPTENPNPVMRMMPDGDLLFANNACLPILRMWNTGVGREVPGEIRRIVREVFESGANREIELPCGERFFVCTIAPVTSEGYVNVYGRDVTERKGAQEALGRQAEEVKQRNAELARLNDLSERQMRRLLAMRAIDIAITSSFNLELVLNILLGQLSDLLGVHAADVLIFQPDLQTFRFCCGRGFVNSIPQQTYLRKGDSYANQAAQDRRIVKVARLDARADAMRIYPKIAGEGFASYCCVPLLARGLVKGVLELFHRQPFELEPEDESFLEMVAGQAAIAIDNSEMFEGLQATNDELTLAYNDTLTGWARTLELRDRGTAGETQRLADTTVRFAQTLGVNETELLLMHRGAVLHDIGMMGIPDRILLKPGPLTEEEWTVVRRHPQHAYDLLSSVNYLRPALDIPYCHHEKWDGSGYPRGLAGDKIPFSARIFALVDVWDALRSDRPYRKAWTNAKAREYLQSQSGIHFDPQIAQQFLKMVAES
jgi:PAS domain S-box-containing protein